MSNNQPKLLDLEARIVDLESKLAFQEHTIQELNDVVTTQQTELMLFKQKLRQLQSQLESQSSSGMADPNQEPPPPHY